MFCGSVGNPLKFVNILVCVDFKIEFEDPDQGPGD